jgi:hypothetical protein
LDPFGQHSVFLDRVPRPTFRTQQDLIAALAAARTSTIPRLNVARLPPERHTDEHEIHFET